MTTETLERTEQKSNTEQKIEAGARLLCIDDAGLRRTYWPGPPVRGKIYCVREIYNEDSAPGVLLVGIRGPTNHAGLECGFLLSRFKWVHE